MQDNIGIGRPEEVSMIFPRPLRRPTHHRYQTRIFTTGTEVRIDFRYKHSRVKQYLKDGRALRIETVINRPDDLNVKRRLQHLPELIDKARQVNQRVLMIEQAGQSCAIGMRCLSASTSPITRRAKEPEPCASGRPEQQPWPAPSAPSSVPSPASPTRASARSSPQDSSSPTARTT